MIRCILVDDNKIARIALKQIISQVDELFLVKECETAMEAYNIIRTEKIDLLFLDIEMPGVSGLELAKQLNNSTYIIFTTGKATYAVDAFELNVVDYLIKPISMPRFLQSVERVRDLMEDKISVTGKEHSDFFFVREKGALKKVQMEDILFFEAMGDYVKLHLKSSKTYMVHTTLKQIEQKITPDAFLRVHRSYIVAMNKIDSIEDGVIMIQQKPVPVADAYRAVLNQRLRLL